MPRVTWLANEVRQAASCSTASAVARAELLNVARAFEPLILESLVSNRTLTEILEGLMEMADDSLSDGRSLEPQYDKKENEFPDPYDFRDWRDSSARLIKVIDALTAWTAPLAPEHAEKVDSLRHHLQVLNEPPEEFDPEADADEFRAPMNDWSIEEMFADL